MNRILMLAALGAAVLMASGAHAQTAADGPPSKATQSQSSQSSSTSSQSNRDAVYPNPSGQDSKPGTTPPKDAQKPKPAAPSSNPRTAAPSEDSGAGKDTYQGSSAGKQPDPSTGCSTPTDNRTAGNQTNPSSKPPVRGSGSSPPCSTSGAEGATRPRS